MQKTIQILFILSSIAFIGCHSSEVKKITLQRERVTLSVGEQYQIVAEIETEGKSPTSPIRYNSMNEKIASVDQKGIITAHRLGKATIEVTLGGKSAYCEVIVTQSEINFTTITTNYWGDLYRNNTNAFDCYALGEGLTIASNGSIIGDGTFVYLDFITPNDHYALQSGTYYATTEDKTYTFVSGFVEKDKDNQEVIKGSYIGIVEDSNTNEKILIKSGIITIEMTNNYYTITGFVGSEKGTKYPIQYKGEISVEDFVTPMPEHLSQGAIEYWGDTDKFGKAALFIIKLGDNTTNMDEFSGGNDKMALEVGVPIGTSMFDIPDGTYPVQNTNIVEPKYIVGGYKDKKKDNYGSWYYTGDEFLIDKGTVTFAKNNTISTITYRLQDKYFGHNINGKWSGELKYSNKSTAQGIVRKTKRLLTQEQTKENKITNIKIRKRYKR